MATIADLPLGAKVKLGTRLGQPITWKLISKDHWTLDNVYPENCATLWSEKILWSLPYDAKEPSNTNNDYKLHGNDNYQKSNIRQWLNSDAAAGFWYSAQHEYDAPPTSANVSNDAYDDKPGFLYEWSDTEKDLVVESTVTANGSSTIDKIFLLALKEFNYSDANNTSRKAFPYLSTNADRRKLVIDSNAIPTGYSNITTGSPWSYWLRSTDSSSYGVWTMVDSPNNSTTNAAGSGSWPIENYGVVPACNIPLATEVSDTIDEDGCYTIVYQTTTDPEDPDDPTPVVPDDPNIPDLIVPGNTVSLANLGRFGRGIIPKLTGKILTAASSLFAPKQHAHTFDDIDGTLPADKVSDDLIEYISENLNTVEFLYSSTSWNTTWVNATGVTLYPTINITNSSSSFITLTSDNKLLVNKTGLYKLKFNSTASIWNYTGSAVIVSNTISYIIYNQDGSVFKQQTIATISYQGSGGRSKSDEIEFNSGLSSGQKISIQVTGKGGGSGSDRIESSSCSIEIISA